MNRKIAPSWLLKDWEQWGIDYEKSGDWKWRFGRKKYQELIKLLLDSTSRHCSYCDNYPMGGRMNKPEIDHFKPKSKFKKWAYQWGNLFIACRYCQERLDEYDDLLLKPDDLNYSFRRFFEYDNQSGEIKPNRRANKYDKDRATYTIRIFKLNGKDEYKGTEDDIRFYRKEAYIRDKQSVLNGDLDRVIFRFMYV